jgi:hypothetical protein
MSQPERKFTIGDQEITLKNTASTPHANGEANFTIEGADDATRDTLATLLSRMGTFYYLNTNGVLQTRSTQRNPRDIKPYVTFDQAAIALQIVQNAIEPSGPEEGMKR